MTISKLTLPACFAVFAASDVGAQDACATLRRADSVRTWCDVQVVPAFRVPPTAPGYPDIMRSADISGMARLVAILDTTGHLRAEQQGTHTHEMFRNSLHQVISQWRLEPVRVKGVAVPLRLEIEAHFTTASDRPTREVRRVELGVRGIHATIGERVWRDTTYVPSVAARDSALLAIFEAMGATDGGERRAPLCVRWSNADQQTLEPSPVVLERLRARWRIQVHGIATCPPTYASMIAYPDMPQAPPGHVDPTRLHVKLTPWAEGVFAASVMISQGTGGRLGTCQAMRSEDGSSWSAQCSMKSYFVS